jgi:glycosyltransferase involved in cell wall biosynthesis
MRVLSIHSRSDENAYFRMFADALETNGVIVHGIRSREALLMRFDILHVHFPDFFYHRRNVIASVAWSFLFIATLLVIRLLGKRVVYSVHDVNPSQSPYYRKWLAQPYMTTFVKLCDAYVFLSVTSQVDFYARHPKQIEKLCSLIAHPPYPVALIDAAERNRQREVLTGGADAFIVGVLGAIKPYKGLDAIKALPTKLPNGKDVLVVVAGKVERAYTSEAERILDDFSGRLCRIDQRLSDTELNRLIQCMDVILLPYRAISNSGFALLALSNRSRILASDLPLFCELQNDIQEPWVYCYKNSTSPESDSVARELWRLANRQVTQSDQQSLTLYLDSVRFTATGHEFHALYERVLGVTAPRKSDPAMIGEFPG